MDGRVVNQGDGGGCRGLRACGDAEDGAGTSFRPDGTDGEAVGWWWLPYNPTQGQGGLSPISVDEWTAGWSTKAMVVVAGVSGHVGTRRMGQGHHSGPEEQMVGR
jgi:hypothetical protein